MYDEKFTISDVIGQLNMEKKRTIFKQDIVWACKKKLEIIEILLAGKWHVNEYVDNPSCFFVLKTATKIKKNCIKKKK